MAATKTIPIVFTTGGDPVQQGYVRSLNRPGGNVTGVSWFGNLLASKGLGLLHELIPNAAVIAQLLDPNLPETARMQGEAHEAARSLGQQLLDLNASTPSEIDAACHHAAAARWRASCRWQSILFKSTAANCCVGSAGCHPGHVYQPRICRRGRANKLWERHGRFISPRRSLRGTHSQWCLTFRPPDRSGHQVRTRRQCQSRESNWPYDS